jgi:excisionase family DNA binding protein
MSSRPTETVPRFVKWLHRTFDAIEAGGDAVAALDAAASHALRIGAGHISTPATNDKRDVLDYLGRLLAWCRTQKAFLWHGDEAADELKISPRTLWERTNAGHIPYIRIGRLFRYSPAAIQKWIESESASALA